MIACESLRRLVCDYRDVAFRYFLDPFAFSDLRLGVIALLALRFGLIFGCFHAVLRFSIFSTGNRGGNRGGRFCYFFDPFALFKLWFGVVALLALRLGLLF